MLDMVAVTEIWGGGLYIGELTQSIKGMGIPGKILAISGRATRC